MFPVDGKPIEGASFCWAPALALQPPCPCCGGSLTWGSHQNRKASCRGPRCSIQTLSRKAESWETVAEYRAQRLQLHLKSGLPPKFYFIQSITYFKEYIQFKFKRKTYMTLSLSLATVYAWHKLSAQYICVEWMNRHEQVRQVCIYKHLSKPLCTLVDVEDARANNTRSPYHCGEGRKHLTRKPMSSFQTGPEGTKGRSMVTVQFTQGAGVQHFRVQHFSLGQ